MTMRMEPLIEVQVDLISDRQEVGRLARMSDALGLNLEYRATGDEGSFGAARIVAPGRASATNAIAGLVLLAATCGDSTPEEVLKAVGEVVVRTGRSLDKRPSEVPDDY